MVKKLTKNIITARLNKKLDLFLSRHNPTIIIVTGSVGKTSTKIAIGQLLSIKYKVGFSADSYNFDISLPLSVFGLKVPSRLWDMVAWHKILSRIDELIENYPYEVVVLEVAEDERAKMEPVVAKLRPKLAVITEISEVHMTRMKDVAAVCRDAWAMAAHAEKILYNADNELLRAKARGDKKALGFGRAAGEAQIPTATRRSGGQLSAIFRLDSKVTIKADTELVGRHNLYSQLIAAEVGMLLGMSEPEISRGLKVIKPEVGRMNPLSGVNGALILDDSYNASPKAVEAALDTLVEIKATGRRVAVLGSMNELGQASAEAHNKIGQKAAGRVDLLVTVGKEAGNYLATAAQSTGLDKSKIKIFRTPYEAGHFLKREVKAGDVVLVKGSQDGVYTEEVSRILLDPSLDPADNLVRQSASWKRKKKRSFAL